MAYCFGSYSLIPLKPDDEWVAEGIVRFNLSAILADRREQPAAFDKKNLSVAAYAGQAREKGWPTDEAGMDRPVVAVQYGPESWRVISGWERIAAAAERGQEYLSADCLPASQAVRYLVDEKDVRSYIEYWNFRAAYWERRDRVGGFADDPSVYKEICLDAEAAWEKITDAAEGREVELAVRWNRWFRVRGDAGRIFIGEARYMEPACPLTFDRIVRKKEFLELFPLYEEWEAAADEDIIREKARRITISYEYIFAMIRQFAAR